MADGERYSDRQPPEDPAKLSPAIQSAIAELQAAFPGKVGAVRSWNSSYVAVPLELPVDLPSRGPVGGVDIRRLEPVLLLFHRRDYPYRAPLAYSDRRDFPKSRLPHLNPTKPGNPAWFCLHRGNLDTWFAEHTIAGLVHRVRGWLRDAARNRLVPEGDAFEPTRSPDTLGFAVFEPERLTKLIEAWWDAGLGAGHAFLWYDMLGDDETKREIGREGYAIALARPFFGDEVSELATLTRAINALRADAIERGQATPFHKQLFGILTWPARDHVCADYFGELPEEIDALVSWAGALGMPLADALTDYLARDMQLLGGIPISIVVPRPKRLVGSSSRYEILNFIARATDEHAPQGTAWHPETRVWLQDHRVPLSPRFARRVSSTPEELELPPVLLAGVGALGSKIALHFARAGQCALTLVDHDDLSPHNLVRHALLADGLGKFKAEALKEEIARLYPRQELPIAARSGSVLDLLLNPEDEALSKHDVLVDATASPIVLNALVRTSLTNGPRIYRTEIADQGRLGLLFAEGAQRNPRLDDLQAAIFDAAIEDDALSAWLRSVQRRRAEVIGSGLEDIQIGLSCSSATMRLADDVISYHAAASSRALRDALSRPTEAAGFVQVSQLDQKTGAVSQRVSGPSVLLTARNDPRWEVRLRAGLADEMKALLRRHRPDEIGGMLVGLIHRHRRIIYVTRLLQAPSDSDGSPAWFVRGTQGLPEEVRRIEERTGGLIGYVGEWHTHPAGGPDLSQTDCTAVLQLRRALDPVRLPTHVMIVTPRGMYPHVFEPGGG